MRNLKSKPSTRVRVINNQFGEFEVDMAKEISFPAGLIGVARATRFVLITCPIEKFNNFMVLQSLERDELALMVMPINDIKQSEYHDAGDLESCARTLGIKPEDTAVVLVVSLKQSGASTKLVVNTQAPIFIDCKYMAAVQYVLANPGYEIQKEL